MTNLWIGYACATVGGFLGGAALLLVLMPRRRKMPEPPKPTPYASAIGSRPVAPWEDLERRVTVLEAWVRQEMRDAMNEGVREAKAEIEAAQKSSLPDGVRVWGLDDVCTYFRVWDGNRMWASDEPGYWFRDDLSHTPNWADNAVPKLHGPEALAVYEDFKRSSVPS